MDELLSAWCPLVIFTTTAVLVHLLYLADRYVTKRVPSTTSLDLCVCTDDSLDRKELRKLGKRRMIECRKYLREMQVAMLQDIRGTFLKPLPYAAEHQRLLRHEMSTLDLSDDSSERLEDFVERMRVALTESDADLAQEFAADYLWLKSDIIERLPTVASFATPLKHGIRMHFHPTRLYPTECLFRQGCGRRGLL